MLVSMLVGCLVVDLVDEEEERVCVLGTLRLSSSSTEYIVLRDGKDLARLILTGDGSSSGGGGGGGSELHGPMNTRSPTSMSW